MSKAKRRLWSIALAMFITLSPRALGIAQDAAAPTVLQIAPFSLQTTTGKPVSLDAWRAHKAVLLFFVSCECPVSNGYSPEITRTVKRYAPQGVACYAVHCDPTVTAQRAEEHAQEYALELDIVLDPLQKLAASCKVRVTPEAVVVAPGGKVLYRGRIDNRYAEDGKRRDEPTARDLRDALDAVLAGNEPHQRQTVAFGCPLPRLKAAGASR